MIKAVTEPVAAAPVGLDALRLRIRALERGRPALPDGALSFGVSQIDHHLPARGIGLGLVHEVAAGSADEAGAAAGFVLALLARRMKQVSGPVLWCGGNSRSGPDLYGPGLADAGLDPAHLILVRTATMADLLWTMEEALRCCALAAVVGAASGAVDLTASRRLQLAAEAGGGLGLVLDMSGSAAGIEGGRLAASALATRWQVAALPSAPTGEGIGIGAARWRLELRRCRGGSAGAWNVEWHDETGDFALVAALADGPRDARPPGQRAAAGAVESIRRAG
ncbi:MAG: hypothetical protein FJX35_12740 [Alphaproteobacteria bacterium]|nr:hypothetical protein [Alphaproteobacteria bacterium]